ncbi:MAG: LarC family nickel insertion protein, partial [Veillonella sp.]|nr:LarC family nickel insertion protein [Veillonella sp.]
AICYHAYGAPKIYVSPVNLGSGMVKCAHGLLPVPAPATVKVLQASSLLSYAKGLKGEAATPTGVAILATLGKGLEEMPLAHINKSAYGFGQKDFGQVNAVRLLEIDTIEESAKESSDVTVLECNIDDMTGEVAGYAMEKLFAKGALDVFYTPIYMKKNRPAIKMTVLAPNDKVQSLEHTLLKETTTIGLRKYTVNRICMERRFEKRNTPLGPVTYKICTYQDIQRETPEFEDLRIIAQKHNLSLLEVLERISH